jgi:choice-of-anchor B domain-containing protein
LLLLCLPLAALPAAALGAAVTRNLTQTANVNEWPPTALSPFGAGYSACWSYVHGDGREYAILGTTAGTAIYNVTNPYAIYRVALIPGPNSAWREMKSYRNWIYIVTEGTGAGEGVQIVRMTNPEAPVLVGTYVGAFSHSHTVSIDTARAILICNGTRNALGQQSGMRILSIADPEAPVEIGAWPGTPTVTTDQYVHDSVPIGNRLYAASIYAGIERVFDFTTPAAPVEIFSWSYPGAFSHNSWPDSSGNVLYVTDEVNGEPLKIFDISNVTSPVLRNRITSNPQAIVHNAHVKGGELYLSNYTEGIRVLDVSDPLHPAEFAWADSYPGASGGFWGVWEVCPFFPSGTVIASDMQTGLYVYRPVRDYGIVRAVVTTPGGGGPTPLAGVRVRLATQGDSLLTPADGIVQFAPSPGTHTVTAHLFGFHDASATVGVTTGSRDTVALSLVPRARGDLSGTIRDAVSLAGLEDAELHFDYTGIHVHTDPDGGFEYTQLPEDLYSLEAHAAGHIPADFLFRFITSSPPLDVALPPAATYDALEAASGWTVGGAGTGDNATSGIWTRVEPLGTGAPQGSPAGATRGRSAAFGAVEKPGASPFHEGQEGDGAVPGAVQPEFDHTPGAGQMCFVTGQGTNPADTGQNDVDGGMTSLTSPALNLTGMADPVIGYWRWFYASGTSDDWLATLISFDGGASWVSADTTRGYRNDWEETAVHVANFGTPTANMKIRFVAADMNPGTVVEAAVDDIVTYDAANATVLDAPGAPRTPALRFAAPRPNPSRGTVRLILELPAAGPAVVDVLDLGGRRVKRLFAGAALAGALHLTWDGADDRGRAARAGLYFVRADAAGARATTRVVRIE